MSSRAEIWRARGRRAPLSVLVFVSTGCAVGTTEADCGAWQERRDGGCAAREWVLPSADDGVPGGDLRQVRVAVSGLGQTMAAWVVAGEGVAVAESPGLPGRPPRLHKPGLAVTGNVTQATIAAGPNGEAVVAWKAEDGELARLFRSERDADGSWRDPAAGDAFSFPPTAYEPVAAYASSGDLLLVWNQWTDTGYGVAVASKRPGGP